MCSILLLMSEEIESRRSRVAAALEKQFEECGRLAATLLEKASGDHPDYYNMPLAVALLRISGQLGTTIMRLEKEEELSDRKKVENCGSIPK
jgi:hypothetical protein